MDWSVNFLSDPVYVPSFDRWVAAQLFRYGLMGKREKELIKEEVKAGQTFIDVGANVGLMSKLALQSVGKAGKVIAIEPDPELTKCIKKTFGDKIIIIESAVGSEKGHIDYFRNPVNRGDSGLVKHSLGAEKFSVPLTRLDDVWREKLNAGPVDWIKIDIQGYEVFALRGAEELVLKNRPQMILEIWPWGLKHAGTSCVELFSILKNWGYGFSNELLSSRSFPEPEIMDQNWHGQFQYFNLVARPL